MATILLIEDNTDIRENTMEILGLAGYNLLIAGDGTSGIQLAIQHKPDLIICDILMPGTDGYNVIDVLKKNPFTSCIPFIFFTAYTEKNEIKTGFDKGADEYITKPFEIKDLLSAIERCLTKT